MASHDDVSPVDDVILLASSGWARRDVTVFLSGRLLAGFFLYALTAAPEFLGRNVNVDGLRIAFFGFFSSSPFVFIRFRACITSFVPLPYLI